MAKHNAVIPFGEKTADEGILLGSAAQDRHKPERRAPQFFRRLDSIGKVFTGFAADQRKHGISTKGEVLKGEGEVFSHLSLSVANPYSLHIPG